MREQEYKILMKQGKYPTYPVLLVDDEELFLKSAAFILKGGGINHVISCSDSRKVIPMLQERTFSAIALDLSMPHISGYELLPKIIEDFPGTPVVIITATNEVETVVQCMKQGVLDYLVKPIKSDSLINAVNQAIKFHKLNSENSR
jgi:DNA-binding NtrC family response regulator